MAQGEGNRISWKLRVFTPITAVVYIVFLTAFSSSSSYFILIWDPPISHYYTDREIKNIIFFKETFDKHQTLEQLCWFLVEAHSPNNFKHGIFFHLTLEHLDLIPGLMYLSHNRLTWSKTGAILSVDIHCLLDRWKLWPHWAQQIPIYIAAGKPTSISDWQCIQWGNWFFFFFS